MKIIAISKSWVMLCSRVSSTELTLQCERKTRKNGYIEVSFWPLIFSSVQNLTFYGLKKNINVFFHRLKLKTELKKVFFMAQVAKPKSNGNYNHTVQRSSLISPSFCMQTHVHILPWNKKMKELGEENWWWAAYYHLPGSESMSLYVGFLLHTIKCHLSSCVNCVGSSWRLTCVKREGLT